MTAFAFTSPFYVEVERLFRKLYNIKQSLQLFQCSKSARKNCFNKDLKYLKFVTQVLVFVQKFIFVVYLTKFNVAWGADNFELIIEEILLEKLVEK